MVANSSSRNRAVDFVALTKPRIVVMVMLSAAAGYWLAGPEIGRASCRERV